MITESCNKKYIDLLHVEANYIRLNRHRIIREVLAEFIGTFILMLFGTGACAQVVLGSVVNGKDFGNFFCICTVWGVGVMLGVYFAGCGGKGIINPAMTSALAFAGKIPFIMVPAYSLAQYLGGFAGALVTRTVYFEKFDRIAQLDNGIYRMNRTGAIFVTRSDISHAGGFYDQIVGTAALSSGVLLIIDENAWKIPAFLQPICIGVLVFAILAAFGLNAGAAINPARDLSPRIMLSLTGWGLEAFSDCGYYFWVPLVGPYFGAIVGVLIYEFFVGAHLDETAKKYTLLPSIDEGV